MRFLLIFCIILLLVVCGRVCIVLAKAPTTPKILFTSHTGWQSGDLHDESRWLRTGEPHTTSRR